ncbi:branched-chain amino acid ABC transporter permease [Paucibacter sp. APW11]|uniref:Branched-chain amino acid ABC transporter permease n=1 Tax=Roseateles aquae TaxID=3077235 RepID=A0ABU3P6Y7_9BURK|nr:branched-chain amino acid ABC transporter permease [Paucibacter sp. APW11]MDT8998308.1 branched-chain amino acid ABC transporter permease [Paucibacter sp. APW11]
MNTSSSASLHHTGLGRWGSLALLLLLAALPQALAAVGLEFYTGVATRVLVFAIAASSLNLILGFGGMVSFGHAAFVGLGAYTVAVLAEIGRAGHPLLLQAWLAWPLAMAVSAAAAAVIGAISLRTRGVYFIMITLAFAQMFYFLVVSLKNYGGDDGLPLPARSLLPGLNLANDQQFYWLVLALAALVMAGLQRLLNAPFGWMLQGIKDNETRMRALGTPVQRLQWQAFVLAAALAGLAGALLVNLNGLVTPHMMHWSQSGQLMIMVIIGGAGLLWGGVLGAAVLLLLEEFLSGYTLHWQMALGLLLLLVVLYAPQGMGALLRRKEARHG